MTYLDQLLDDVRQQLAPDDAVLKEARARRDVVKSAAMKFDGALRVYNSGSLAHGTANCPVHQRDKGLDADCGVVLDRRTHTTLGPDGVGVGPTGIVEQVKNFIAPKVRASYPRARFEVTKRAILVRFNQPLASTEDPTVDLIVALTRRDEKGLWIPNTETDIWDASDPEQHTKLFTEGSRSLNTARARAVRLAKAENKRDGLQPLCSFNIESFGWMFTEDWMSVSSALSSLWRNGAVDLMRRLTPDPAGVSDPIKVNDRIGAANRLWLAADKLDAAKERPDDEQWVRQQLAPLWPEFIDAKGGESKARLVAALNSGTRIGITERGKLSTAPMLATTLKHTRSFGALK